MHTPHYQIEPHHFILKASCYREVIPFELYYIEGEFGDCLFVCFVWVEALRPSQLFMSGRRHWVLPVRFGR